MKTKVVGLVGAALLAAAPLKAQTASMTAATAYEMRGVEVSSKPMVQAGFVAARGNISAAGFATYSADRKMSDLGVTLEYDAKLGRYHIVPGVAVARFVPEKESAAEMSLRLVREGSLTTRVFAVQNLSGPGTYLEAGASKRLAPFDLEAAVAYNGRYYREALGLSHIEVSAALPARAGSLTVKPQLVYEARFNGEQHITGKVAVEYTF